MTVESAPRILATKFLEALRDAGVIQDGDWVRRVIIDAEVGSALVMYVERIGDTRMLELARTLDGVEIREVGRPDAS